MNHGDQVGLEESREQFTGPPRRPVDDRYIVIREWRSNHPTRRHTLGDKIHRLSVGPFKTRKQAEAYRQRALRSDVYGYSDDKFHVVRMRTPETLRELQNSDPHE